MRSVDVDVGAHGPDTGPDLRSQPNLIGGVPFATDGRAAEGGVDERLGGGVG